MNQIEPKNRAKNMMLLFMFTYLISYVTRINYGAVISEIVFKEGISSTLASLAISGSAVSYGLGQLLSGYMGDKFQPKKIVLAGLIITSAMNLAIPFCGNPYQMAIIWTMNGLAQAFMWPPLVKLMISIFTDEEYKKAVVVVSLGGSLGTIVIYLTSPVIIALGGWRWVFIFSALAAIIMTVIWSLKCPKIDIHTRGKSGEMPQKTFPWSFMLLGILFAIAIQGYLRDGVSTWMPSLVAETTDLSSKLSILSGVAFPIFSIIVFQFVSLIYRKYVKNELKLSSIIFFAGVISALMLAFFNGISAVLTIVIISLLIGSMHGVNLMLISMVPRHYAKYGRISLVSGLFNSFAYLGSAASAYSIAAYAEKFGWSNTSLFWAVLAFLGGIICLSLTKSWSKFLKEDKI